MVERDRSPCASRCSATSEEEKDSMIGFTSLRRSALATGAICLATVATACGGNSSDNAASGAGDGKKVYMLLPNTTTVRFVTQDGPKFKTAMERALPGAEVVVQNA